MKKKLLRQILNEWHTNVWLALEFLVVSVVLWYICDYYYASLRTYCAPLGFEYDHCYDLTMYEITDKSPDFRPEYANDSARAEARHEILRRLKQMEEGKMLISDNFFNQYSREPLPSTSDIIASGKKIFYTDYKVNGEHPDVNTGAVVVPARYSDFQLWSSFALQDVCRDGFHGPEAMAWYYNELTVRVRPEHDRDFSGKLMSMAQDYLHVGNYLLTNVSSIDDIRRNFQRAETTTIRNYSVGMGFLMINIFLGLLGTFWFRTQQRVNEIAIRRVNGATRLGIFRRLIGEGLLLLALVTPAAIIIDFLLLHYDIATYFDEPHSSALRIIICAGAAFSLMALMVMAGIWFPARRAMRIEPAEALSIDN